MVFCAGGNYVEPFRAGWGITQGGPLSSLMLNICIDVVVREWLWQCLGDDAAWMGIGEAVHNCVMEDMSCHNRGGVCHTGNGGWSNCKTLAG